MGQRVEPAAPEPGTIDLDPGVIYGCAEGALLPEFLLGTGLSQHKAASGGLDGGGLDESFNSFGIPKICIDR